VSVSHNGNTPEDIRGIEAALERLAQADRESAPAELEQRVFHASRDQLGVDASIAVIRPTRARWAALAVAAGLAVCGGVILMVASRPHTQISPVTGGGTVVAASLEEDVELWLSLRTPDEFQNVADRIDLLSVDTDTVRPTDPGDLIDLLDTDAM
jgi:hypothetical protein